MTALCRGPGDVVLGFDTPHQEPRAWLSARRNDQAPYAEHHHGVFPSIQDGETPRRSS